MLNFIATHDSFIALGLGSLVPEVRQSVPRMLVAAGVIAIGLALRIGLDRRRRAPQPLGVSQPRRTLVPTRSPSEQWLSQRQIE